eukprot:gnl/TRDRNA2_/TRDRNA2_51574_c0_seq1.p1 gnl/TRDRNA2_/TRDRNA2_51574_c0~~gnl/TRDRNA2_/TRDRNA2_51574_c0_seq1.p1  ORF type:complete len:145 (-),score=27.18 gnl/TRDRNA2_/TRDRNA2_51574_c0_seq1:46-480(-)
MRTVMLFLFAWSLLLLAIARKIKDLDKPEKAISYSVTDRSTDNSDLWKRVKETEEEADRVIEKAQELKGPKAEKSRSTDSHARETEDLLWIEELVSESPKISEFGGLSLAQAQRGMMSEDELLMIKAAEVADLAMRLVGQKLDL